MKRERGKGLRMGGGMGEGEWMEDGWRQRDSVGGGRMQSDGRQGRKE